MLTRIAGLGVASVLCFACSQTHESSLPISKEFGASIADSDSVTQPAMRERALFAAG